MIPAAISAAAAIIVAALTFYWTKRRDREADWRKLKLEQYRDFVAALSGIIGSRSTAEAQRRYSDAANSLNLVASPEVLRHLHLFIGENSYRNNTRSLQRHDEILTDLLNAMRADVAPREAPGDKAGVYMMIDVAPDLNASQNALAMPRELPAKEKQP